MGLWHRFLVRRLRLATHCAVFQGNVSETLACRTNVNIFDSMYDRKLPNPRPVPISPNPIRARIEALSGFPVYDSA